MKHIHFVIYRLKCVIDCNCYYFFSDYSLPLSRLIIPNPHGKFKLIGRNIIFQGSNSNNSQSTRSLILKEGILDQILEVFVWY
jgi:hypothetical protein